MLKGIEKHLLIFAVLETFLIKLLNSYRYQKAQVETFILPLMRMQDCNKPIRVDEIYGYL